jgi:lysophospholipase L1-like esterase
LKFHFGHGAPAGYIEVLPTTAYFKSLGYGFDLDSKPAVVDRSGKDPLQSSFSTAEQPFFFSAALPEGNYNVTILFGDAKAGSTNTVKAETRRLMLERVITAPGQFESRTFTVNIRTPKISEHSSVHLKDREKGVLHWDDKLTLEFNGARPAISSVELAPATNAVTVFLLGDSTVTDQPKEPWNSWGQMLTRFFKPGVAIANHAESGESIKSSLSAHRVEKVLTSLKRGDYVFIQFGHNDMKDHATNALAVYKTNLEKMVSDIRARQATPVLITSMERMAGVDQDTLAGYPSTVIQVARELNVALIDLHAMSRTLYRALGPNLKRAFQDGTHHNAYGSYELARCVVEGIRNRNLELSRFIVDDLPPFDPHSPDHVETFEIPPSPSGTTQKPEGS